MEAVIIGIFVGVVLGKVYLIRKENKRDLEFFQTMMKCYDDARRIKAPTDHLDRVIKSVNPRKQK